MRHKLAYRKLNRTTEHRIALFKNMLNSLIKYEQITTTLPKAKELKPKIDKVITLGKKNNLQSKKFLFSKLQDKSSVDKLIKILAQRYVKRNGGYSRVIRSGFRYGDDAPMAVIELIDRDIQAKKVDIKKKIDKKKENITEPQSKAADKKKPSDEELDTFEIEAQKLVDDNLIIENRKSEYPVIGDQLDYIFHNGVAKWKTDMIEPVKTKYPKPS